MTHAAAQHDHGHDPHLAHHFDSRGQQYASAKTGMWVFLATEIIMFGGLFCAYAVYRSNHPEIFQIGHLFLDRNLGALNTVILLLSSFTMAWAVRAAQMNQKQLTVILLTLTLLGAAGFMVVKYVEYAHKIHLGIAPGRLWNPDENPATGEHATAVSVPVAAPATPTTSSTPTDDRSKLAPAAAGPSGLAVDAVPLDAAHLDPHQMPREQLDKAFIFFSVYYLMTGLHGIHVLAGMGLIIWLIIRSAKGEFSDRFFTPVDLVGLYWHLVDLIWIFLFPLLYLIH